MLGIQYLTYYIIHVYEHENKAPLKNCQGNSKNRSNLKFIHSVVSKYPVK